MFTTPETVMRRKCCSCCGQKRELAGNCLSRLQTFRHFETAVQNNNRKKEPRLTEATVHAHTLTHTQTPFAQPRLPIRASTAYPVSAGGNVSVPVRDELLRQSLEQSLHPNEGVSTDPAASRAPGPHRGHPVSHTPERPRSRGN